MPEVIDFAVLARIIHALTTAAIEDAPTKQRRGRADHGRAVALVMYALNVPQDEEIGRAHV